MAEEVAQRIRGDRAKLNFPDPPPSKIQQPASPNGLWGLALMDSAESLVEWYRSFEVEITSLGEILRAKATLDLDIPEKIEEAHLPKGRPEKFGIYYLLLESLDIFV